MVAIKLNSCAANFDLNIIGARHTVIRRPPVERQCVRASCHNDDGTMVFYAREFYTHIHHAPHAKRCDAYVV